MTTFKMQRWSAIALLVFLTIHMIFMHYVPPYEISFTVVQGRLGSPLWKTIDILFLFSVLIHALAGTYQVITDFESGFNYRKAIAWAAIIIGVLSFIYGAKTIWAFQLPM